MRAARRLVLLGAGVVALAMSVSAATTPSPPADYEAWRRSRAERLMEPDSWLTLVGLHWLDPGEHRFGGAPDNDVVLETPNAPLHIGRLVVGPDGVRLHVSPGMTVTSQGRAVSSMALSTDKAGAPTLLELGSLRFFVIERGGQVALRVKDSESPVRKGFRGLTYFPYDPSWRVEGRFEASATPQAVSVPTVLGVDEEETSPGSVVFTRDGQEHRLVVFGASGSESLFLVFGDKTNGRESYPAGRFLSLDAPRAGRVVVDFNRAYNPPCAFTKFATCPLPPPGNRLPLRVDAGEMKYTQDAH